MFFDYYLKSKTKEEMDEWLRPLESDPVTYTIQRLGDLPYVKLNEGEVLIDSDDSGYHVNLRSRVKIEDCPFAVDVKTPKVKWA